MMGSCISLFEIFFKQFANGKSFMGAFMTRKFF
jgi:hypothetical protein